MASDDDGGERALVPARPPARFRVARDLASARARELVHLDRRGRVRSPARLRVINAVSQTAAFGMMAGAIVYYGMLFGPVGVAIGGALAAVAGLPMWHARRINLAVRLMTEDRLDEARGLLEQVLRARLVRRRLRGLAHLNLAAIWMRQGDHARALGHHAEAAARLPARTVFGVVARTQQVLALTELGRRDEARLVLAELARHAPDGEFVQKARWTAELHVAFGDGRHDLDGDELHRRALAALRLTVGGPLLALLAWAHHHAGDVDQAWHLLREALAREDLALTTRSAPSLHRWIAAHEAEARAAAPPDDD